MKKICHTPGWRLSKVIVPGATCSCAWPRQRVESPYLTVTNTQWFPKRQDTKEIIMWPTCPTSPWRKQQFWRVGSVSGLCSPWSLSTSLRRITQEIMYLCDIYIYTYMYIYIHIIIYMYIYVLIPSEAFYEQKPSVLRTAHLRDEAILWI